MSVRRFDLVIHCPLDRGNDWQEHEVEEDDTVRDGRYVLHADHLAEVGKKVAEARRAAYSDAVNEVNKEFSAGPIDWRLGTADNVSKVELAFYERLLEIRDWLEARAEGRGE